MHVVQAAALRVVANALNGAAGGRVQSASELQITQKGRKCWEAQALHPALLKCSTGKLAELTPLLAPRCGRP